MTGSEAESAALVRRAGGALNPGVPEQTLLEAMSVPSILEMPRHVLRLEAEAGAWWANNEHAPGGVERIDDADEADLRDAIRVGATVLSDQLVDALLVLLTRQLNQQVVRIHLEHAGQQLGVIDVVAVGRITVATGAGMNADVVRRGNCL